MVIEAMRGQNRGAKLRVALYRADSDLALHPARAIGQRVGHGFLLGLMLSPLLIPLMVAAVVLAAAFPGIAPEVFAVGVAVGALALACTISAQGSHSHPTRADPHGMR